jgi:hypothetical protein
MPTGIRDVDKLNNELLEACKSALECIALLTPITTGEDADPIWIKAIENIGDYADSVRSKLRNAIEKAHSIVS